MRSARPGWRALPADTGERSDSRMGVSSRSARRTSETLERRPGQLGCPFGAQTPVVSRGKPWNPRPHLLARKPPVSSDFAHGIRAAGSACHAEGRGFESLQPLLRRPAIAGLLCVRSRLVRLRRVGLIPDSRSADRRPFQRKPPVCRPILVRPNPSPSARLQEIGVRPAAAVTPIPAANGTIPWTAPAGRGPCGPVRFQSGTATSTSPAPRPG